MYNSVLDFIKDNWHNTVRDGKSKLGIDLPFPITVPCINERYVCFFYWDTYFTNLGLLIDYTEQARNNIENMKFFVEKMGYIPNGNERVMFCRSQPPLYPHAVMDYYRLTNDVSVIRRHYSAMKTEYNFWMKNRITEIGLNQYGSNATKKEVEDFFDELKGRGISLEKWDYENVIPYFSEAESGWDFSMRYPGKANNFVQADLNAILFGTEKILAECADMLGNFEEFNIYNSAAATRKNLMEKYLMDESGVFHDYDFINGKISSYVCGADMLPFTMRVSTNKNACLLTLKKLEYDFGVSVGEKFNDGFRYQWAYPNMWAPIVFWTYKALSNVGLMEDAKRVAEKYMKTVDRNFAKTQRLWEKYDCTTGAVSNAEYPSPPMMGWTAGVYRYFKFVSSK